jgi:two-component system sensor histidine kinase BarA
MPQTLTMHSQAVAAKSKDWMLGIRTWLGLNAPYVLIGSSGGLLIICLWYFVALQAAESKINAMASAVNNLSNVSSTFKEHSLSVIGNVDEALRLVKYHVEVNGAKDFSLLDNYFKYDVVDARYFNQVGYIDGQGMYAFSNMSNHRKIDLSDREHFKFHQDKKSNEIFISVPVIGRATQKWSIQFTRRINKANGDFDGVSVVSFDPKFFVDVYQKIHQGRSGLTALVGLDGRVRAMKVGNISSFGQDIPKINLPALVLDKPEGNFVADNIYDSSRRIYTYTRIDGLSLVLINGMLEEDALMAYKKNATSYFTFALFISILTLSFLGVVWFLLMRQKKLNLQLVQSHELETKANQHKSDFLAGISHELRTPLNGVIGYAEYIFEKSDDPMIKFPSKIIYESGNHLLNLVNTLLDLSKIDSGVIVLMNEDVDVRKFATEIIHEAEVIAKSAGLVLTLHIGDSVPPMVTTDRLRLRQVLTNLINNAIKFTPKGGSVGVTLALSGDGKSVRFAVKDTGVGIPKDKHPLVFTKFWQSEGFVTREHGGAGLGLALSKNLVNLMGGDIGFLSEPGLGSEFTFFIPINPYMNPHG